MLFAITTSPNIDSRTGKFGKVEPIQNEPTSNWEIHAIVDLALRFAGTSEYPGRLFFMAADPMSKIAVKTGACGALAAHGDGRFSSRLSKRLR